MQLVQQRLRVLGFAQAQALEALILLEAVALRLFRADAYDMVAVDVRPSISMPGMMVSGASP